MKCLYYLAPTIKSTRSITDDLHEAGINDWFIHVLSHQDEAGLKKEKIHSSNYLEKLDILRFGMLGAIAGLVIGLLAAALFNSVKPFGPDVPDFTYLIIIVFLTLFGSWEGGLTGIASENKKVALFHDDLESGQYLLLIYAKKDSEDIVKKVMATKHSDAKLVAVDVNFYNPLTQLKRI